MQSSLFGHREADGSIQQNILHGIESRATITPRDYQSEDCDKSFELWDGGSIGTLTRAFTGGGKTIIACLKFERWMDRDERNHCMVISYEKQLVHQFAQEISDVLSYEPGIEMERHSLSPGNLPRIIVASRQSLLKAPPATDEQKAKMREAGLVRYEAVHRRQAKKIIECLVEGFVRETLQEWIDELNEDPRSNRDAGSFCRIYKLIGVLVQN